MQNCSVIAVHDSLYDTLDDNAKDIIINLILRLRVEIMKSTQQNGTYDCGLFAIVNVVAIANGLTPIAVCFNLPLIRNYFTQCNTSLFPCTIVSS